MHIQFNGLNVWNNLESTLEALHGKWGYPLVMEVRIEHEDADGSTPPDIIFRIDDPKSHVMAMELVRHFRDQTGQPATEATLREGEVPVGQEDVPGGK